MSEKSNHLKRDPFTTTRLEEERREQDVVSVKLVNNERRWLEALKRYYQTPYDSTALKNAAFQVYKQQQILEEVKRQK